MHGHPLPRCRDDARLGAAGVCVLAGAVGPVRYRNPPSWSAGGWWSSARIPYVLLVIVTEAGDEYELVGEHATDLWRLQQRHVTVHGRLVRQA